MKTLVALHIAALMALAGAVHVSATDWPQWRGPHRDGISSEKGLLSEWAKEGPAMLWMIKDAGAGYSTPSVVGDRFYVMGSEGVDKEFVQARSVSDGKLVWSTTVGKVGKPNQQPSFPSARSTPTVDGNALFALGSDGDLVCLETTTGKLKWKKSLVSDFGGKAGIWAYAESPLIDGNTLVVTPGGDEATLVALNKQTGEVIWKCAAGGDEAGYSSAIVVDAAGKKQYVQLLANGLVGVDAKTGKLLWRFAKAKSKYGANIPTPVADKGMIYCASAGTGGGAVNIVAKDGGLQAEEAYFNIKLPQAIGGAVKVGDNLFGTGQSLVCLDFKTGNVKWEEKALGAASICLAGGLLYLHGENGAVALVEANAEGYKEKGRFTPPDAPAKSNQMEKAWAYPVVANGKLYLRDKNVLWCYDVRAGK
jgi:outer membrane protein assembly factor BamB